jgi:hypothetical protein
MIGRNIEDMYLQQVKLSFRVPVALRKPQSNGKKSKINGNTGRRTRQGG